jgi:hypothetical protein
MYLSNLGIALQSRFEQSGQEGDLDAAINAGQEAVYGQLVQAAKQELKTEYRLDKRSARKGRVAAKAQ